MSPSNQERLFQKSYSADLLSIARMDLKTAEYLRGGMDQEKIRDENYFFIIQQSIEKSLKAVLVFSEVPVPMVHDLGVLIAKVPKSAEPPFGYEITRLSEFAAVRRYEESNLRWGAEEADEALRMGQSAIHWAESVLTGSN